MNSTNGLRLLTELDIARLLDVGETYIMLLDEAMETVQSRLDFEKKHQDVMGCYENAVSAVAGIHIVYSRIFCNTEQKMTTEENYIPSFRDYPEINEMRKNLGKKIQDFNQFRLESGFLESGSK